MLKWFSGDESSPAPGAPAPQEGSSSLSLGLQQDPSGLPLAELTERLAQMEQLTVQLKELIREKDNILCTKDEQLKAEKDACEAKLSKLRLQNKAKVTSLNSQLEDLRKQLSLSGGKETKLDSKKSATDGDPEHATASRGKILLLKKKVEELEEQLSRREEELRIKTMELEAQQLRGTEIDAMLVEKDKKLAEKEAYIVELQVSMAGSFPKPTEEQKVQSAKDDCSLEDLQLLVQNLTRKVGESEEKYSLLQEQTESLKELLQKEKAQFEEKENMYKENIQTFKLIILQKDNQLNEVNQKHEQELFKLAAKSDASADLEQLLKALKQKLHEKEEVMLGKTQVIDVLQREVDGRDGQIKELMEKIRRLQSEKDNMQSKLDAEKHVMRAQLRDLMQKHEMEMRQVTEKHESELSEKEQEHLRQMEELRRGQDTQQDKLSATSAPPDMATAQKLSELEAQAKLKAEEASKSEAKFLKMKAWSKSRIKQLEDELRKAQSGKVSPDINALRCQITDLEEERQEMLCKLEHYDELKIKNEQLITKLLVYEEQQRKMQADLEQVTKRAASQTSESGSADDLQTQLLEWQEMAAEAESARDQAREEKAAMALRMSHIEEEREALASRHQELEEELAQAKGLQQKSGKKLRETTAHSLQEDFEFDGKQSYPDPECTAESTSPLHGENMGGLRSVVEELELERNQLQEQILGLEEHCQNLEDRLQLQARIESLQIETERLQAQLASLRSLHSRDAEKHQLLVSSLNEQLKGLSETQECLETSLMEKEQTIAQTSEKLELMDNLRDSLKEKEVQHREVTEKLLQSENQLTVVTKKCNTLEKQCSELKSTVSELTQKLSTLKEKIQKQEATIESLQSELEQTNDELDKLNSTHLEERAQLIHDLQSCEREIDNLKDILSDKDKEISGLSNNMAEYVEQILELKRDVKDKEEALVRVETALTRAEQTAQVMKDSQSSDQQALNAKITDLMEQLKITERKLSETEEENGQKTGEIERLIKQIQEDNKTNQTLHGEIQKLNVNHCSHLSECESQISFLKEQLTESSQKLKESEDHLSQLKESSDLNQKLQDQLQDKEQMYEKEFKFFKEERNRLLAEVDKQNHELQAVSRQLVEQVEGQEHIKTMVQEKLETISLLEQKISVTQEKAEDEKHQLNQELRDRDSDNERLRKELQSKSEAISELQVSVKTLESTNQQLQTVVESNKNELAEQKQLVAGLNEKAAVSQEENLNLRSKVSELTEETENLRQEVTDSKQSQSLMQQESKTLQSKITTFELLQSENGRIIEGLLKEKEELTVRINELSHVLEQNRNTMSENLLAKINECSQLTELIFESKNSIAHLQEQVSLLNSQVHQLRCCVAEKEKVVVDQNAHSEKQESQIRQLQESLSLLQEQSAALKLGLIDKDSALQEMTNKCTSLHNENLQQKEFLSHLQSETESLRNECTRINNILEEKEVTLKNKIQECQNYFDELRKSRESVDSLCSQLGEMNEKALNLESANADLKISLESQISGNNQLCEQNISKQSEVVSLQRHIQVLCEENQKLQAEHESREKELAEQKLLMRDVSRKTDVAFGENDNLKAQMTKLREQIERLQQDIAGKDMSLSEAVEERTKLQDKICAYETQQIENNKIIERLLKGEEELALKTKELKSVCEHKDSILENLLEKTKECSNLTKLLSESKEMVSNLQDRVNFLNSQMEEAHHSIAEKEKFVIDQKTLYEMQQNQLGQLQETVSLLQEQSTALKSGLMEKDLALQQMTAKCNSLETDNLQHKQFVTQLQSESESFRNECTRLSQSLEEKEVTLNNRTQECQTLFDEMKKSSETVFSLNSQLDVMNKNMVNLESENGNLRTNLEHNLAENVCLREQVAQRQTEVADIEKQFQVLHEENCKIKTENQNLAAEVSQKLKEIDALQSELSNRKTSVVSLTEQLAAVNLEKESLQITLQQKNEGFDQQEVFINQLQAKSVEAEGQLNQKIESVFSLQTQVNTIQKSLQEKDTLLKNKDKELKQLKEKSAAEAGVLKSHIDANTEVINNLQGQLQSMLDKNGQLNMRVSEKESELQQKSSDFENLKAQFAELEDSALQLRNQVEALTLESGQLMEMVKEKEQAVSDIQSGSLAHREDLRIKFKAKEDECKCLKDKLSECQETMSKLNEDLSAQSSEIASLKKALEEKDADRTQALGNLQGKADEAALFKAQFMESTELVSQLQDKIQKLSSDFENHRKIADDKQSAFLNLQEKNATHLKELHVAEMQLSQKDDEITNLKQALSDKNEALKTAESTTDSLRNEAALLHDELKRIQESNAILSKQKEDALATQQTNTASLTVEIKKLKSQHLHVAAQMNALTENLEQRELALHAINNQYSAQVKHAEYLAAEMQKLEEQNRKLREESGLAAQLGFSISEKELLQQELKKILNEKEELKRSHSSQLKTLQEVCHQSQQQINSMNNALEKLKTEKELLQVQVSDKDENITRLKLEIEKIGQTLQESESEWLSVLDRVKQDKNLLAEQIQSIEKEGKSKDVKVQTLEQELHKLQERFVEVTAPLNIRSEQIKEKHVKAEDLRQQISRNDQLEVTPVALQKEENINLQSGQTLIDKENELRNLELSKQSSDVDFSEFSKSMSDRIVHFEEESFSLQTTSECLETNHQSKVESLRDGLSEKICIPQQNELLESDSGCQHEKQQVCLLREQITHLQREMQTGAEKLREAGINQASLLSEIQKKEDQISCINIQVGQQKELIATLSQQLREKDISVTQVMVSASNEMVRHKEEKNQLLSQLESLENAQSCSNRKLENITLQLEECKAQLSLCQGQIERMELEGGELARENGQLKMQHVKLSKEKELMKKKLQAALVVRKDLLKRLEENQKQIEEHEKSNLEISSLHEKLKELTSQVENTTKDHETHIGLLKEQITKKECRILELSQVISGKEILLEQVQNDVQCLQTKLNEQEANLSTTLQSLQEKCELIDHLRVGMTEKEEAFEHERSEMKMKLDQLQNDLTEREKTFSVERAELPLAANPCTGDEITKIQQENAVLKKKFHAALLARKETMKKLQDNESKNAQELSKVKEDLNNLLKQNSQLTNERDAIQIKYDETVKDLEEKHKTIVFLQEEVKSVRISLEEKDKTLQNVIMSFSKEEDQAQPSLKNEVETDGLANRLASMTSEMDSEDTPVIAQNFCSVNTTFNKEMKQAESEVEKTQADIKVQSEEFLIQKHPINAAQQCQQEKQPVDLQAETSQALAHVLPAYEVPEKVDRHHSGDLSKVNEALVETNSLMKENLENALSVISQKSLELQTNQNTLKQIQHQFCQEKECLKTELEEYQTYWRQSQAQIESLKLQMEILQTEKEKFKEDAAVLETKLSESEKQNEDLLQKINTIHERSEHQLLRETEEFQSLKSYTVELEVSLKNRDNLIKEKQEVIASLEQQLQKEIHLHEVALEKEKVKVNELQQRSLQTQEAVGTAESRDEKESIEQVTRKFKAALISRKEVMKENQSLKEKILTLATEKEKITHSYSVLDKSFADLKQHKEDLENSVLALNTEKEKLLAEVDRILSDNHNLSAACESLKLTIENITQQKQAFSCQMESLKDSQTVELSEWKSKHTELKQEFESLLQAYENVSNEMDKMRQLLEAARKEKQEVVLKALNTESEKESLGKQLSELEEENEKVKENMHHFTKTNQQKIQELEEENKRIRNDLVEFDKKQKCRVEELLLRNSELEAEISSLKKSSEKLRIKFNEIQCDNSNLAEELKSTSNLLERWHSDSKASEHNLQSKLDDALRLNDALMSEIEGQKAEIAANHKMIKSMQEEKLSLSEKFKQLQKDQEIELRQKDKVLADLQGTINQNIQETVGLNEKVRILEDDKSLLLEELENVQETSDKVKNENEYLETLLLKNSERIDELTGVVKMLQAQNTHLSAQLTESKEEKAKFVKDKEGEQLKLVKEFEEKLKIIQRGSEGSKTMKKELQELLKEKHQEINQLQHDCIKYQELILELEKSLKLSQSEHKLVETDLKGMNAKVSDYEQKVNHLEAELASYKNLLSVSKEELEKMCSGKDKLKEEMAEKDKQTELQMMERERALKRTEEQQMALHKEKIAEFQNQINELQGLKASHGEVVMELKRQIDSQDLEIKTLKRESETKLAQLEAFSTSLKGKEVAKQLDDIFQKTVQVKDNQLLEQGYVIMRLLEDARVKDKLVNELQVTNSRQDRALNECTVAAAAQQRQLFVMGLSNTELSQKLDLLNTQLNEQNAKIDQLEYDKGSVISQLTDTADMNSHMKLSLAQLEQKVLESESQHLQIVSQNDKLKVNLQKQEAISLQLKSLLQSKDDEISLLLSSKDGQMSEYLEQLQRHYRAQITNDEERLSALYNDKENADKEFRELERKFRILQVKFERSVQEKEEMVKKMETLKNSMKLLQAERERLISQYKLQEAQHQSKMKDKDGLVNDDAGHGLKREIKILLHQMDDLNSENAMLKAQLIRYREDLNHVLLLKDNQLKEFLRKNQDSIRNLENQKAAIEKQSRESQLNLQKETESNNTLKAQNSKLRTQVQQLEASILALRKERSEINESKVIADLQLVVAAKAAECTDLQQKLLAQKMDVSDMKRNIQELESQAEQKLGEAKSRYTSELNTLETEVNLISKKKETADAKVDELSRELIQTEQLLSSARIESRELKSQQESLRKAMAALQNDRDQRIEDFKILRNKYDEELRETTSAMRKMETLLKEAHAELSTLTKDRYILAQKLSAFESTNTHSQLLGQIDELCRTVSEKDTDLKRLLLENDTYKKQLTAFSGSMASLQDDRDRLVQELAGAKRMCEAREGACSTVAAPLKSEEFSSLKSNVDALQTEKDRLLTEVGKLRSENVELKHMKLSADQYTEKDITKYEAQLANLRAEKDQLQAECSTLRELQRLESEATSHAKESAAPRNRDVTAEKLCLLRAEPSELQPQLQPEQQHLQQIQQRDLHIQQLNAKLLQTVEEKMGVSSQLKAVSQALRDTQLSLGHLQNRYCCLESQVQANQNHAQEPLAGEVPPGAPQGKSDSVIDLEDHDTRELQNRLAEAEQQLDCCRWEVGQLRDSLVEEQARRKAAEEALGLAQESAKSSDAGILRATQREFSIQLESDDETDALIINPHEHVIARKVKGGALLCRRWLRGRSLYCSKLLTSRAKSRYLFLMYILALHLVVFMCLTGTL